MQRGVEGVAGPEIVLTLDCHRIWNYYPLQSEVTMASLGGFMQAPMNRIRFSWRVFLENTWFNALV